MAKIYGLFGAMTGKLADTVMAVRNGEQLARKYQPIVYNPSTPAQVAQRAKMKMLSQLSAVLGPVIAFRRSGSVSARNLFTKKNFSKVSFADDEASIQLSQIDLTGGIIALPAIIITRASENFSVRLSSGIADLSRVVYVLLMKQSDEKLRIAGTSVATVGGTDNNWPSTLPLTTNDGVILAYGVRDNTERARVTFGDLIAPTAESVAKVITTASLLENDVSVTETQSSALPPVS